MFKLYDTIPATPECSDSVRNNKPTIKEGKVVYIHPLGRFYTLEFKTMWGDSFRESRWFTEAEFAEGVREGLFPGLKAHPEAANRYASSVEKKHKRAAAELMDDDDEEEPVTQRRRRALQEDEIDTMF